jgi:hypothetical protein
MERPLRLLVARTDVAASRRFLGESLGLRTIAEDATSVTYEAGDAALVLDWTLGGSSSEEVVLLVEELDVVRDVLRTCGAQFTAADTPGTCVAVHDRHRFVVLEVSDACLMWPSVGWKAGPTPVVYPR